MRTTPRAAAALGSALLATGALLSGCAPSTPTSAAPADAGGTVAATSSVGGIRHLDVPAFAALAAAPGTVVLDVRTPEEFAAGHLRGARLLDFRAADFDSRLRTLDPAATYAVYCRSDNRSGQALEQMAAAGFTDVADLSGGIIAWTAGGRPVVT